MTGEIIGYSCTKHERLIIVIKLVPTPEPEKKIQPVSTGSSVNINSANEVKRN